MNSAWLTSKRLPGTIGSSMNFGKLPWCLLPGSRCWVGRVVFQDVQGPLELGFVLGVHQHRGVFDTPAHQPLFRLGASPDEHPALRIELHVLVVRALPDESDFFLGEISRRVRSGRPVRVEVAMLRRGFR